MSFYCFFSFAFLFACKKTSEGKKSVWLSLYPSSSCYPSMRIFFSKETPLEGSIGILSFFKIANFNNPSFPKVQRGSFLLGISYHDHFHPYLVSLQKLRLKRKSQVKGDHENLFLQENNLIVLYLSRGRFELPTRGFSVLCSNLLSYLDLNIKKDNIVTIVDFKGVTKE